MRKRILLGTVMLGIILILPIEVYSQNDTIQAKSSERIRNIVTVEEDVDGTRVTFPGGKVVVDERSDTITRITVGRRQYLIIDRPGQHTSVQVVKTARKNFKGHWAGFDIGLTNISDAPFSGELPQGASWLDLNSGKSVAVGMNIFQYNIGLQKNRNNMGLVTGLGWIINNYRFDSQFVPYRDEAGMTSYFESTRSIEKSKLVTSFATVPLLFEYQFPSHDRESGIFISAGLYGSFRLGSHLKVVYNEGGGRDKEKSREDLNLNAFKYGAMVRAGYKWIKLYAKWDFTPLFEKDRGPEVYPWTVGLTLLQF
ncbi:PorT family protein [Thermophagus sp. OGC60D27]|uniref:PorT family protein n=1 Tax=Thermophagus sp. OGC60D27 TaxID=3458415 RepID=UPI004037D254